MTKKKCYFCKEKSKHCKGFVLDFAKDCPIAALYYRVYVCKVCLREATIDSLEYTPLIECLELWANDREDILY